jgi:hypothetical protein
LLDAAPAESLSLESETSGKGGSGADSAAPSVGGNTPTSALERVLPEEGDAPGAEASLRPRRGCRYHRVPVRGCSRCAAAPDFEPDDFEAGDFRFGRPYGAGARSVGGAPPIGAFRTARGVMGFVDPDGPEPVHPRHCPGEGSCVHCVALQHWRNCQILKAQRAAASASSMGDAASERRPAPAATIEDLASGRLHPGPVQGQRKWRRRKRKALPPGDAGGEL